MAQKTTSASEKMTPGQGQDVRAALGGSDIGDRDIGDRARMALILLATLTLVVTFGHWALTIIGLFDAVTGRTDFSSYYAAALALRENIHANIYSATTIAQAAAQGQTLMNPPLPYTYPPLLAIALSPFTVIPFRTLSRLWMLGSFTLWIGAVFVLATQVRYLLGDTLKRQPQTSAQLATAQAHGVATSAAAPRRTGQAPLLADPTPLVALALAAVVGLGISSAYETIVTGQVNFLVLAPLAVIPTLSNGRHERWVGVMVALAAMLKLTPIILVVYLLLRRRWEAAISALVALAALSLLSILIVGPGVFFAFIPEALKTGAYDATARYNQALLAPIGQLMGHTLAFRLGEYGVLGLLALVLGYVLWRAPYPGPTPSAGVADADRHARAEIRAHNESETLAYGVTLCAMLLLSPTVWSHHYVWLIPAAIPTLALTARRALTANSHRQRRNALVLLALASLASLALDQALPYEWDTGNPVTHTAIAGVTVWPYILDMRPLAALTLVVVSVILLARLTADEGSHHEATHMDSPSGGRSPTEATSTGLGPVGDRRERQPAQPTTWAPVPASNLPRLFKEDG